MSKKSPKRRTPFIPEQSDQTQEKFICYLMKRGKKSIARHLFQETLNLLKKQGHKNPEKIFEKALENAKPTLEVKPKRIGGAVYQIPMEVPYNRQFILACRWILGAARGKKGYGMAKKLASELEETANGTGAAIKKKEETHKMAQANRAFAHYARY